MKFNLRFLQKISLDNLISFHVHVRLFISNDQFTSFSDKILNYREFFDSSLLLGVAINLIKDYFVGRLLRQGDDIRLQTLLKLIGMEQLGYRSGIARGALTPWIRAVTGIGHSGGGVEAKINLMCLCRQSLSFVHIEN